MSAFAAEREVPRVASITAADFGNRYLLPRKPVIVTDAADAWPARHKWTWEWLTATFGDRHVLATDRHRQKHPVVLADYVAYALERVTPDIEGGPLYLSDLAVHDVPELHGDYETPSFVEDWFAGLSAAVAPPYRWFFIGPASTGSDLHIDTSGTHAWLTQLQGEKEWRLFATEELPEAYCPEADAFAPNLSRFPAFASATCYRATLGPGETIFVPCGWRHQVRNASASWALTGNFFNASNAEEVYQLAEDPRLPLAIDGLCQQKARELAGPAPSAAMGQAALLRDFLERRAVELRGRLADIEAARQCLAAVDHL